MDSSKWAMTKEERLLECVYEKIDELDEQILELERSKKALMDEMFMLRDTVLKLGEG
jgi:hypothetical protein